MVWKFGMSTKMRSSSGSMLNFQTTMSVKKNMWRRDALLGSLKRILWVSFPSPLPTFKRNRRIWCIELKLGARVSQQTRCPVSRFFEKSMESTLPTSCLYQQYAQYCRVNIDILYTMNIKTPIYIHMWFTYTSIYNIHTNTYIYIYIYIYIHIRISRIFTSYSPRASAVRSAADLPRHQRWKQHWLWSKSQGGVPSAVALRGHVERCEKCNGDNDIYI